jgi:two-component system, LytTR family, sensor kinase
MWLIFTLLIQINLFIDSGLPLDNTIAFATRSLVCNMTVFYLFFYVVVPNTLLRNRIAAAIVAFPLCIILWIILNHYCLVFIAKHFHVEAPYYKQGLETNLHESFWYVISARNIIAIMTPAFYSLSPYFFTKIVFDIVRFNSSLVSSEKKRAGLEIEKLNLERDFLKAQLNPHFLFNTLNNLYGLALRENNQAAEMILQLAGMMRYTLYESNSEKVPLKKELEYLKSYVMLEKSRYKNNKQIIFNIDDSQINEQLVAPLLTFTFIENAFKYGLKSKDGLLKVDISVKEGIFYFCIVNDKNGKPTEKEFGGIGHANVRKRLALLYPLKHELTIEDRGSVYFVAMRINLEDKP